MRQGPELLHVKNLSISHIEKMDSTKIVEGVCLKIHKGETVGLIGPSGTGKTVTAKAILRLLDSVLGETSEWEIDGEVLFRGRDLLGLPKNELRELRGKEFSVIFQNPTSSLNPVTMVGQQTGEPLEAHEEIEAQRLRELVIEYLGKVELPDSKRRSRFFRHQFSGGESQRIMIAMALICRPSLLVADEPTSNFDVTVQRQVLELLKRVKEEFELSTLLMTHDIGVIAELSDYVYVMYAGRIIEHGDVFSIFKESGHPYTRGLLRSVPRIHGDHFEFEGIPGEMPHPPYDIPGCIFHPRCRYIMDLCTVESPVLEEVKPNHHVACLRARQI